MNFDIDDRGQAYYETSDGDMVDLIAFKFYGQQRDTAELVLDYNRGLADYGPILPAGLRIYLPPLPEPEAPEQINIFD